MKNSRRSESGQYGEYITSRDNTYNAVMQKDGNFVLYKDFKYDFFLNKYTGQVLWSTNTKVDGGAIASFSSLGTFRIVASGTEFWKSRTQGCSSYLLLQNDGKLVAYGKDNSICEILNPCKRDFLTITLV